MSKSKIQYFEIGLYLLISIVALVVPLYISIKDSNNPNFFIYEWLKLLPFFIIFIINNFIFVPKFLFKEKFATYIISCLLLLISLGFLSNLFLPFGHNQKPKSHSHKIDNSQTPIHGNHSNINNKTKPPVNDKAEFHADHKPPVDERRMPPNNMMKPHRKPIFNFGVLIIGFLVLGFNSGVKIFVRSIKEQEEHNEKEKQYLNTELAFLKYQISPHFFMNTLNNIHALIDIDSEKAKDSIIKLSKLMRYLLYETNNEKSSLIKEISFIESYIELMRLRYNNENLSISMSYTGISDNIYIPSLLFLPLIENAFKHGISNNSKSYIDINITVNEDRLIFVISNSNFPQTKDQFNESSGIGLENIKKRLNLVYKNNYSFVINSTNDKFEVEISIPLL